MASLSVTIKDVKVNDVRFPTSSENHGSDSMHTDPNYSLTYVTLITDSEFKGFGFTFTIGRGNEIVVKAVEALKFLVIDRRLDDIIEHFGEFWYKFVNESQLRWVGPQKGVIHMATGAIINALWDLWARIENKPLWKLLVDMSPEQIVNLIDFTHIEDFLTKDEAISILKLGEQEKQNRVQEISNSGYPTYTTSAGWLGYSDQRIQNYLREAVSQGFSRFKVKVGVNLNDDRRRLRIFRDILGYETPLMTDANQRWSVQDAIEWMQGLADMLPYWIEEPTSPDDILGHAEIRRALEPLGIRVATGEMCHNKVMFKQFLKCGGMQVCQLDSCRVGGVNEVLAIMLMAAKARVPLCPHAGGVGLCEYVQHLVVFDYVSVSCSLEGRMCEYIDHLHEHFKYPVTIKNGAYFLPQDSGYSAEMLEESILKYSYPDGEIWKQINS